MGDLGNRPARGVAGSTTFPNQIITGGWVIRYAPEQLPSDASFEMWHAAIRGPGGYFLVFLDDYLFGVGQNGFINEYAPRSAAMLVRKGQTISFHWSITTGTAPTAVIYLREPEVGRL